MLTLLLLCLSLHYQANTLRILINHTTARQDVHPAHAK